MPFSRALALALLISPASLLAQTWQPVALSDADALAEQVRRLGANPLDLNALLTAGELSIRMEDLNAAGAFFARAEKIDPRNGRAKAGEAAILVRSERPGEALRYFGYAEGYGLPVARFASDRGLAYDLLGDPGRAQRDYKLALASRDDPETRRRYALSLGIAGRQAQALDELAPLIRQNDRAAWRSRAFVLAMGGNAAEASRIAQTMMPPGAAAGLQSFFADLPRLPPIDRAFAVHFGEVRSTPQRLADARLAPVQAPLALEPLPVQVATAAPVQKARSDRRRDRDRDRARDRDRRTEIAAVIAPTVVPLPAPPAYQAPAYAPYVARTPVRDRPLTAGEQASLAAAGGRSLPGRSSRSRTPTYTVPNAPRGLTPAEQASLAAASVRTTPPVVVAAAPLPAPRRDAVLAANTAFGPRPGFTAQPVQSVTIPHSSSATNVAAPPVAASNASALPPIPLPQALALPNATPLTLPPPVVAGLTSPPAVAAVSAQPPPAATSLAATLPALPTGVAVTVGTPTQAIPGFSSSPVTPAPSEAAAPNAAALARTDATSIGGGAPLVISPTVSSTVGLASTATRTDGVVGGEAVALTPVATPNTPEAPAVAEATTSIAAVPVVAADLPIATASSAISSTPLAPLVTSTANAIAVSNAPVPRPRSGRGDPDSILAKIVAGLTIPAAELDIAAPTRTTPGAGKPLTAAALRAANRLAPADKDDAKLDGKKGAAARKALADKKAAADEKALADKEAADAKRIERTQPPRIWVQVAGGANEAGLAKTWRAMKGKAPGVLGGQQAYTTPLRATNRVLTGPFKTDAEARAYVNQLAKSGVSAFTFTSDKGQKITKLGSE